MRRSLLLLALAQALLACAAAPAAARRGLPAPPQQSGHPFPDRDEPGSIDDFFLALEQDRRTHWPIGKTLMQGWIGAAYLQGVTLDGDGGEVEIDDDELENFPVIGGGGQLKLAGGRIDFGVEAMIAFSFRSDLEAFAVGGGGGTVVLDVDVLLIDVFGGPFVSVFLGERTRVYASAGPILHFLEYSQEDDLDDEESSGSGGGVYARAGIEWLLPSRSLVGFGVRYSEGEADLGSDVGDFDVEEFQLLLTLTRGS
jgi:hypothetical protein